MHAQLSFESMLWMVAVLLCTILLLYVLSRAGENVFAGGLAVESSNALNYSVSPYSFFRISLGGNV